MNNEERKNGNKERNIRTCWTNRKEIYCNISRNLDPYALNFCGKRVKLKNNRNKYDYKIFNETTIKIIF